MNRHDRVRWLVRQNFDEDQLECRTDQPPDVSHESQKKQREHIDKIRSVNENVYERCYVWSGEPMSKTPTQCEQESAYKRLEAEYQSAIDAYSASLLYAMMTEEVEEKVSDEIAREVHEARINMEWARYKLNAYRRKHIIPEDWNCR